MGLMVVKSDGGALLILPDIFHVVKANGGVGQTDEIPPPRTYLHTIVLYF